MSRLLLLNPISLLFAGLLVASAAFSDQVQLKNGRTLNCTILSEKGDQVEISMGTGSMNIPRSQIAKLVRSSATPQAQKSRFKGNILSAQHAPKQHAAFAAEFRKLMAHRNTAWDAQYMLATYEREIEKLKHEMEQTKNKSMELSDKMGKTSEKIVAIKLPEVPPMNSRGLNEYNQLIAKKQKLEDERNTIYAQFAPLQRKHTDAMKRISELQKKCKEAIQPIPGYHKDLRTFQARYAAYRSNVNLPSSDEPTRALFARMDRYMNQFNNEIDTTQIKPRKEGNATIVRAIINGTTTGDFVFDTGASVMTISRSFANQLGIPVESLPTTKVIVADGSEVDVKAARLNTVALGDTEIKNVDVVIVEDSPNNPHDGLLGMTFLKHFSIRMNGATGELELTRFSNH